MYKEHPIFIPPEDQAILYRYMDFTKFVSILDTRSLFFARADRLGDPFEGSLSKANVALRPLLYKDQIPKSWLPQIANFMKSNRQYTFISCWHEAIDESAAMWRLYARESDGIAIRTSFGSFVRSLEGDDDVFVGKIQYVDYDTTFIPEGNSLAPFVYKRRGFEHENEVRAVTQESSKKGGNADLHDGALPVGRYHPVNVSALIEEVVIAPFASEWFKNLVKSVAARYDLKAPVKISRLAESPTWG